jgi:hypothetical protein
MKRLDQRKLRLDKVVLRKLDTAALAAVQGGNGNGFYSSCGVQCGCEDPRDPTQSNLFCQPA